MPTLTSLPPLSATPGCQESQLGRICSETPVPVGKEAVTGTLTSIHLLAETSSLGIGSKSCTSLHRSTMQHPCWSWLAAVSAPSDQCQEGQSARSQTLPCRMAEVTSSKGWKQAVRHRCHSARPRVSAQCTTCTWQCSQCPSGP